MYRLRVANMARGAVSARFWLRDANPELAKEGDRRDVSGAEIVLAPVKRARECALDRSLTPAPKRPPPKVAP